MAEMNNKKASAVSDDMLDKVAGGAIRPKYVSSFFCEKCGKTIHLNGVYTLERAVREHEQQEHSPNAKKR
jgi:hypothetical protein